MKRLMLMFIACPMICFAQIPPRAEYEIVCEVEPALLAQLYKSLRLTANQYYKYSPEYNAQTAPIVAAIAKIEASAKSRNSPPCLELFQRTGY